MLGTGDVQRRDVESWLASSSRTVVASHFIGASIRQMMKDHEAPGSVTAPELIEFLEVQEKWI